MCDLPGLLHPLKRHHKDGYYLSVITLHGAIILNFLHDLLFLREKQGHREIVTGLRCEKAESDPQHNTTGLSRTLMSLLTHC